MDGVAALDLGTIEDRLAALRQPVSPPAAEPEAEGLRRHLSAAAHSWLRVAQNPDQRFMLGLDPIDVLTRGFGPRELIFITGFAHSGKTQIINTAIVNNREKPLMFFSLDDPAEMIGIKLLSMASGIAADTLEQRARAGDSEILDLIDSTDKLFPNLFIVDQAITFGKMEAELNAAIKEWGQSPAAVFIDYMGLIPTREESSSAGASVLGRAQEAKRWAKDCDWPTIMLHQGTRGQCPPGKPVTITSMAYGGEAEGTMILGARRKSMDEDLDDHERGRHQHTITLHLVKNKRPPGKKTSHEGVDFYMDPQTGMIRAIHDGDLTFNSAANAAKQAAALARATPDVRQLAQALDGSIVEEPLEVF